MLKINMGHYAIYPIILCFIITKGLSEEIIESGDESKVNVTKSDDGSFTAYIDENNHENNYTISLFKINTAESISNGKINFTSSSFRFTLTKDEGFYIMNAGQSFDYEQVTSYSFYIQLTESAIFIDLNINNIDDESPILSSPQCQPNFKENHDYTVMNSTCSCQLSDPDGWLAKTTFEILPGNAGNEPEVFGIDFRENPADTETTTTVFMYLKKQLDYEDRSLYMFTISAKDGAGHPSIPEKVNAIINVDDQRDTKPKWTHIITYEQFEEQTAKSFDVVAIDGDVGLNKTIAYKLIEQTDEDAKYVSIGKNTGIIDVQPIDRDKNDLLVYELKIAAYVEDEPEWSSTQNITFYITDIDNNPPLIRNITDQDGETIVFNSTSTNSTTLSFLENYTGNLKTNIFIKDIDTGDNARFDVELEPFSGSIDYTQAFIIVPTSGYREGEFQISVRDATYLNYEDPNWIHIKFNVLTKGVLDPKKQSRLLVDITLIDYNDESPKFREDKYSVEIKETAKKGDFITQVLATDEDAEDKVLKHELIGSAYTAKVLRIESDTGKIFVNSDNAFDYDKVNPIFVQVVATDKANHSATVPLTINLEDVNNKAPTIDAGQLITIEENQEEGTILKSTITASDVDTTAELSAEIDWTQSYASKNSRRLNMTDDSIRKQVEFLDLTYKYTEESKREIQIVLQVNDATTHILAPDYELFDSLYLNLVVTDSKTDPEFPKEKSSNAFILISIIDINDNAPYFVDAKSNRTVEENADAGTSVGAITAVDDDVTDNVTYSCKASDPNFDWLDVDTDTGTFTVKNDVKINADTPPTYYFHYNCSASDNNMTHTVTTEVAIYILDRNNKYPVITIGSEVSIYEKPPDKSEVVEINVTDADRDVDFHTVQCRFQDQNTKCGRNFFIQNDIDVRVRIGQNLNRDEGDHEYECPITCEDNQKGWRSEGSLSTNTTFKIVLLDINDHIPELAMDDIAVYENLAKNQDIGIVMAKDIDEGDNAEIQFSLTKVINEDTGEDFTYLFQLERREEDYKKNLTHKQVHLVAKEDLKGHYGKYKFYVDLKDMGKPPNQRSDNRTLTIEKFNFESPRIIFPTADDSFTLSSSQEQNSPLQFFKGTGELEDFKAADNSKEDTCQKWPITFSVRQLSPAGDTIFKMHRTGDCTSQLQINDNFNSVDVLSNKFELEITAQLKDEQDKQIEGAPSFKAINISIIFASNSQQPYFDPTTLSLSFLEDNATQQYVLKEEEKARYQNDIDYKIYYYLITENNTIKDIFVVNRDTGDITTKKKFYYDDDQLFKFQILASNDTNLFNKNLNSYLNVIIQVEPINYRPPQFGKKIFFGAIMPGFISNTPIITAEATDPDKVKENKLEYWINGTIESRGTGLEELPSPSFTIESDKGRIILMFGVESTMTGYFTFQICVKDEKDKYENGPHTTCTSAKIFIITQDKTVDFRFYNNVTEVQRHEDEMLDIMKDVIQIDAYKQSIDNVNSNDGVNTRARLYFINKTTDDTVSRILEESSVTAVDSRVIMRMVSTYDIFTKLQSELKNQIQLYLAPFPPTGANSDDHAEAWLIGVSVVLAVLCVVLLSIFIFKIKQLNSRIHKLTEKKFGSQESGLNRIGINAPTTNRHAIEGSNPIFNIEETKNTKDMNDFETASISGDSDLIGVEDNPEFDYDFNKTDEKTTYL